MNEIKIKKKTRASKFTLMIYLKKYWFIAFKGTEKQCRKHLSKMPKVQYYLIENKKGYFDVEESSIESLESIGTSMDGLKYINHTINYNNKLNSRFWVEIRAYSNYYTEGELYTQLLDNKLVTVGKLINKYDKNINGISQVEAYMSTGLDKEEVKNIIISKNPSLNFGLDGDNREFSYTKAWNVSIMIFEQYKLERKANQGSLNF